MVNKQMKGKLSHLKNVIPLDTGSTLKSTIMKPNPVTDKITIRNPVGMNTNTVTKRLTLKETLKMPGPI